MCEALTLLVPPVEGQSKWDDSSNNEDEERHILQGLPHQAQERLWSFWWYHICAKHRLTISTVKVTLQTWKMKTIAENPFLYPGMIVNAIVYVRRRWCVC